MKVTRYGFDCCVGAFSEMSTRDARAILPAHLQPVEAHHERSVMSVLAFRFTESVVGAYDELVMAIITPPQVEIGKPLPKAAFFPFMVATSTRAAREHAIERWCLPHIMRDMDFEWDESDDAMTVKVSSGGQLAVELRVTAHEFHPTVNPYHCFTVGESVGEDGRFKVNIFMDAPHSAHEEEAGELVFYPHEMTSMITLEDVASYPFREEWYRAGVQTFEELERI
ncbi:MAG: hypothetical protein RQ751_03730 [Longimicrobiales bacterium]|nr:hypothetical protein [Longimicrobiales bacterium]